ncbi:MAG: pyridoxal phosphate-dependent transferase, partial [Olpidium bornovanus]
MDVLRGALSRRHVRQVSGMGKGAAVEAGRVGASWGTAASAAARAAAAAVSPVAEGRVGGGVLSGCGGALRSSSASPSSERRCFSALAGARYAREGDPQRARGMGPVRGQDPADQSLPVQTVETIVSPSGGALRLVPPHTDFPTLKPFRAALPGVAWKKSPKVIEAPNRPIYLDMQATTPTDPRVVDAMLPFMSQFFGNPHSRTHQYGWEAEKAVEEARKVSLVYQCPRHVAALINADPKEIVFTSGATESNNMSIKGVARFYSGKKNHIVTTQTEHKCVLDSCRVLQEEGFQVTYLPVNSKGIVSLDDVRAAIQPETALVSIMTVNNEIGVIQPIEQIGAICREKKVFFHTDAAQ